MKRILIYALILALLLLVPVRRADVGQLRPVEVVVLYKEEGTVYLETDTLDLGVGENALEALADMKAASAGVIYLDTAEYLLVSEEALEETEALRGVLKKTVKLCQIDGRADLQTTAQYLSVHGGLPTLAQWEKGSKLPVLSCENGRLKIIEKSEKFA